MPELPEVQALVDVLGDRLPGQTVAALDVVAFSALKTFDPPPTALAGRAVTGVARHGKFLDVELSGHHLVVHLARGGWIRWRDELPTGPARRGRNNPLAARLRLASGSGLELTEAGTQKRLALYVVRNPADVPGVAALGPDPLAAEFDVATLRRLLAGSGRAQLKGVLRDQRCVAGIGNAYSDEVLHAARLSPFKPAANLTEEEVATLHRVIREVLVDAVERSRGVATRELKAEKRAGMRVHGRTGQPCPVCGDTVAEVSFADSALQYCPTCQTGGKPLADRRLSRLLK